MKRDKFFWITIALAAIVLLAVAYVYVERASVAEDRIKELTALQQSQLELFQQRIGILLTVGTLAIGGAGALMMR